MMDDKTAKEEFEALPKWLQELWELSPRIAREAEATLAASTEAKVSGEVMSVDQWYRIVNTHALSMCGPHELAEKLAALQLPAPQSPVVPGVDLSKIQRWEEYDFGLTRHSWGPWVKFEDVRHLLANARESREGVLREALERIVEWGPFPDTGKTWTTGEPMSYGAAFGSNGERDFMRNIAREALATVGKEG